MRELNAMQAANWFGRGQNVALGGVCAHLYVEFEGTEIDLERLKTAFDRVLQTHAMLRLIITPKGMQTIAPSESFPKLEIDDLTMLTQQESACELLRKREYWTHQQLDLTEGQSSRFSVSLLPGGNVRFHIDTDMVAVDPSSFQVLMEDLALLYENPEVSKQAFPSYFEWFDKTRTSAQLRDRRNQDRLWWQKRIQKIAPAPSLPLQKGPPGVVRSHRLHAWLQVHEYKALRHIARKRSFTLSSLMLGVFAMALSDATKDREFRLNVPLFWRHPLVSDVEKIIGDFVNLTIVSIDLEDVDNLDGLCQSIGQQMLELLEHSAYPGVNLMRDLSRHHGSPQLSPIVFTSAVDLPGGDLFSSCVKRVFGNMIWAISQGPQVALDAQVVRHNGGILINWDVRLDALPQEWVVTLFNRYVRLLKEVALIPETMDQPIRKASNNPYETQRPLTPMQGANLFGRTVQYALGGVAMQEFREYRGTMDVTTLRDRLTEMVGRYESLRTLIDQKNMAESVSECCCLNLHEFDFTAASLQEGLERVKKYRETYSHAVFDLKQSPWNMTVFHLKDKQLIVFVRFDALILNGRSVSALLVELFEGRSVAKQGLSLPGSDYEEQVARRKTDQAYWESKLSGIIFHDNFPWKHPLSQLRESRYERQSLEIEPKTFECLCQIGAKQGLFKNSTIMTIVLEALAHISNRKSLGVAVPVIPPSSETVSSRSTFIPITWAATNEGFTERAIRLQTDVLEGLGHLSFSGVDIARWLLEKNGVYPVLPIVITNGLSWPVLSESSSIQLFGGLTQTPQVAIDVRFVVGTGGSLVFDVDYARDAIANTLITDLLKCINHAVLKIVESTDFSFKLPECLNGFEEFEVNNRPIRSDWDENILWAIYQDVIGESFCDCPDSTTSLAVMGLLPRHLKVIAARLNEAFSVNVSPTQLLTCRNIHEVECLLKSVR